MERWGKYWVFYYIVFLAVLVFLLVRHWDALKWEGESYVLLLAAIFGVAAGSALTFTICTEFGGRMVLLIPAAVRKLKAEGKAEGVREGIQMANQRWVGWLERRSAAERAGLPFDEPPPTDQPQSGNGHQ